MIGHVSKGASFFHCISYCLEDKIKLTEEMKRQLTQADHLQHKDRAEVLEYNLCFGDKYELAEQFRDVMKLSKQVEKPVLHLLEISEKVYQHFVAKYTTWKETYKLVQI